MKPRLFANKFVGRTPLLATLVFTGIAAQSAWADDLVLKASDAFNTSSFPDPLIGSAKGWGVTADGLLGAAATSGNNYSTGTLTMRTPANSNSYTFPGDSLTINGGGGQFFFKSTGTTGVITVNDLILNGGIINFAYSNSDNNVATLAGAITVDADSYMGALGGNNWAETLNITAPISGSAGLTISGSVPNGGTDTGTVRLSSANTYSGTVTVASPNSGTAGSATNRLLQLNHLNALQNATLNLASVVNAVSFTSAANTGDFNVGGLSGFSNQRLIDTASNPVTLNVGANDASTSYTGILSGTGSLIKLGGGMLTLTNANTYSGNTTVSAGTLSIASPYLADSSQLTIDSGAFLNLTYGGTDVVAGLEIAGDPKADGIYGAIGSAAPEANWTDRITGSGLIQVINPTPQDISLIASDAYGTSSFTTGLHWSNGIAPIWLNNYFTSTFGLRTPPSAGTYTFAGASLSVDSGGGLLAKGGGGSSTQNVTVNNLILNGGSFYQGNENNDTAVLNLSGAINVTAPSTIGAVGSPGNDSVNFETFNIQSAISGSAALTVAGTINNSDNTGVVTLSAANPYSGNITVAQPRSIASMTNRLLQLNHLDALANATLILGTTAANGVSFASGANTGTFNIGALAGTANQSLTDTAGGTVNLNIGGNDSSTSYSGILSGDGALTKSGGGTLTLSGQNSYTGATSVNEGSLVLSGAFQSIGSMVVADDAGIGLKAAADYDTVVTTTDLTLGTSGPTNLTLDFNGFDTQAPLLVTGDFTANGTVNVTALNGGLLTTGSHPLIGYSPSSFSGTSPTGTIFFGTRGSGTLVNDNANGVLKLNVTNDLPKWTGLNVGGNWVVGATSPNSNWKLIDAGTPTDYIETDYVLFDDSAAGTTTIDISAADVNPSGVTFDTDATYTLGGAFGIAGSTSLVKDGSGTLIIKNTNTFTGTTTINDGTLQLGDGVTDGSIGNTSNILNDGTLVFNRAGSFNFSGLISGSGSLVKSGPGTQTLSAANTYDWETTVTEGLLANGINNALPTFTDLTVSGGTYDLSGFDQRVYSLSDGGTSAGAVTNSGALKTLTVDGGDSTFACEISGPLNLAIQGPGTFTLPDSNSYTGRTRISFGTLAIGNDAALGTGLLDFNGGAIQSTDSTARTITNPINFATHTTFSGTGNLTFTATPPANGTDKILTIDNPQTEFQGVLAGASGRIKEGSGLLIFSGLNTYSGDTTVNNGTLRITNPVLDDAAAVVIGTNGVLDLPYNATDQVGSLTINGDVKGDGLYSNSTDPDFITGTGSIRVGPEPQGYASWTAGYPFTVGVNDGTLDDPDGDGISNLLEYVLGGIPIGAGSSDTSILPSQALTATDLVLTFERSDLSENDVTLKAQWSDDMMTWHDFATIGAVDSLPEVGVTETGDLDTVVVTIPRSTAPGGKLFARLQALK